MTRISRTVLLLVLSTAVLLPRARAELLAQWDLAVELCCDERAACRTDRLTVAAALLRFQRLVIATAQPAPLSCQRLRPIYRASLAIGKRKSNHTDWRFSLSRDGGACGELRQGPGFW